MGGRNTRSGMASTGELRRRELMRIVMMGTGVFAEPTFEALDTLGPWGTED